jgi:protein-tyrosine phosphatase
MYRKPRSGSVRVPGTYRDGDMYRKPEGIGTCPQNQTPMIDLHCHILPMMDDGPETLREAVAMCRAAADDGIDTIVATPHYKPGSYEFTDPGILEAVSILSGELKKQGVGIRILPGAEMAVFPEMHTLLMPGGHLTINRGRYFLAEFRPLSVPADWAAFLLSFLNAGMTPIIAHPERNAWFIRHPEALADAVQSGILIQVTATSITGGFGPESRDFTIYLLRQNLVHMIASDGHSADLRPPQLSEAVALAADVVGREKAETLVTTVPQAIIESRPIPTMEPVAYNPQTQTQGKNWFQRIVNLG